MIKYFSVLIVVLDQLTKFIVHSTMNLYDSIQVVPYLLNFTYIRNEGIAFGIYFEGAETIFIALPILITIYLFYLLKSEEFQDKFSQIGLFLIIAGAVGNIIDRIFRGYVVDFIDIYVFNYHWPAFNIADSCISIGFVILIFNILFLNKKI